VEQSGQGFAITDLSDLSAAYCTSSAHGVWAPGQLGSAGNRSPDRRESPSPPGHAQTVLAAFATKDVKTAYAKVVPAFMGPAEERGSRSRLRVLRRWDVESGCQEAAAPEAPEGITSIQSLPAQGVPSGETGDRRDVFSRDGRSASRGNGRSTKHSELSSVTPKPLGGLSLESIRPLNPDLLAGRNTGNVPSVPGSPPSPVPPRTVGDRVPVGTHIDVSRPRFPLPRTAPDAPGTHGTFSCLGEGRAII